MTRTCSTERARPRRVAAALLGLAALAAGGAAQALSTDREQPINIEADRAEADDARRVTIYRGDVVIVQGTLRITGHTVTIHYDADNEMTRLVSEGEPAHFRQLPDGATEYQRAWARRMEYYTQEDLIVLIDEARYEEDGGNVVADRIVYDSRLSRFKAQTKTAARAGSGGEEKPSKPGRVSITIPPKKKSE